MMASNESYDRVRIFHKACFWAEKEREKLHDARRNRKFSEAKQPDMAEGQPCVATAVDESAIPRTSATVPGAGSRVERWHSSSTEEEEGPAYEAGRFD